ncbi:hypothetical protein ACU5AX_08450, partial [Sphingomonas sp. XXL09]|uniref:hypothetical protein n=1 Tax=Sphingomonas sp. XXL09 TaxID=3457787 RepID=UPI00406BB0FD
RLGLLQDADYLLFRKLLPLHSVRPFEGPVSRYTWMKKRGSRQRRRQGGMIIGIVAKDVERQSVARRLFGRRPSRIVAEKPAARKVLPLSCLFCLKGAVRDQIDAVASRWHWQVAK